MYLWDQSAAEIVEAETDNQITANADTQITEAEAEAWMDKAKIEDQIDWRSTDCCKIGSQMTGTETKSQMNDAKTEEARMIESHEAKTGGKDWIQMIEAETKS